MKKIIAIAMVVVLALTAVVGTTFAYFTDEDSDVNVMIVGNVKIDQKEQERKPNADGTHSNELQDFTQDQKMSPVVGTADKISLTVDGWEIQIRDADSYKNYIEKIVNVENTGYNDAYVRTIIAFPEAGEFDTTWNAANQWLHWNGVSDTDTNPGNGWIWGKDQKTEWPANTDNWDVVENVLIGDKVYDLYIVTNKNVLKPNAVTAPNLTGVFLDSNVSYDSTKDTYLWTDDSGKVWNLGDISKLEILVATQAVQAEGFDSAWTALDTAFGDITATNHPWSNTTVASTAADVKEALAAGGNVQLSGNVVVTDEAEAAKNVINGDTVVNFGDMTISLNLPEATIDTANWVGINVEGGNVYFNGENGGVVTADNSELYAVVVRNGANLTINGGNYIGGTTAVQVSEGTLTINGGYFECQTDDTTFLLNCKDAAYNNGTAKIIVKGGTFVGFNPADNEAETGDHTNFVAEGYKSVDNSDGTYTVVPVA